MRGDPEERNQSPAMDAAPQSVLSQVECSGYAVTVKTQPVDPPGNAL
jgi:hypothetical protein